MSPEGGAGSATLAYDPAGRLYQTALGAVGTRFLYDGVDMIAEYDDDSPTLLRRFVHGPGVDEPIIWYEGSGTTDRRWLVQDRLGSVIAVTDGSGAPLSINSYDEYGVPSSSNAGRFQYTGQMWIAEAGLYHYKARAYAPSLGRFLQSDPILYAGGMNLYAYVGNDPLNGRDPSGLDEEEVGEIIVTGIRPPRPYGHEDFVSWRNGMDARTAGHLADAFRWLDKINWDRFCAQHSCDFALGERPVEEYCRARANGDFSTSGYLDVGGGSTIAAIGPVPVGPVGGFMLDLPSGDIYAYVGGGIVLGAGVTLGGSFGIPPNPTGITTEPSRPSTGLNVAGSLYGPGPVGVYVQGGYSWGQGRADPRRGWFTEAGVGGGTPSGSLAAFYSWRIGNLCSG